MGTLDGSFFSFLFFSFLMYFALTAHHGCLRYLRATPAMEKEKSLKKKQKLSSE